MFEDLIAWLQSLEADPVAFLTIFFIFAILATIILPIPVEIGLIFAGAIPYPLKAIVLGLGKAVGSTAVFSIGVKLEPFIEKWSNRFGWFKRFIEKCQRFVEKYGYYALYILLSIPLMLDTVPLYLFSIMNKDGKLMSRKWFALTNFLAGITRAAIAGALFYFLDLSLFG